MNEQELRITLGLNMKKYRLFRRLSQLELAELLDISVPFLSDIETGKKWVSATTMVKIAETLKVEVYELFKADFTREYGLENLESGLDYVVKKYGAELLSNMSASLNTLLSDTLDKQLAHIFTDFLWQAAGEKQKD